MARLMGWEWFYGPLICNREWLGGEFWTSMLKHKINEDGHLLTAYLTSPSRLAPQIN
jgi:hypothetical protein